MSACPRCGVTRWHPYGYSAQGVAREQCHGCGHVVNNHARPHRAVTILRRRQRPPRCPRCGGERFAPHGYAALTGLAIDRCLACGRQMRNYARVRDTARRDARIHVSPDVSPVDAALALIAAGVFLVDDAGAIWRTGKFSKWGTWTPLDPPVRADALKADGYRKIHFKVGDRQHEVVAARVVWALRHGPIPAGHRVSGARFGGTTPRLGTHADNGRAARRAAGLPMVARIDASVPTWLSDELREEICQEIAVAVLSGAATVADIPAIVRTYKTRVNRTLWPSFERLSLDAPISRGSTTTFKAAFR